MRFKKKWKKVLQPDKGKYGIYKKAGIVLLLSIVMFSAVYVTDNHRQLAQDENGNRILERKGQGEGKKTEKIQMETGEWKEKMKVQISEKKYAKEEIGEQLSKAAEELPAQILGENKSLDEVRSDLNLIMEIPHTGISVSWELDNYEVMNSRGVLKQEKLTEEGTLVKLTAVLRYDEEKMSCEFYAHLFSTPLSKKEGVLKKISQEVEKADQEQREKDYLILPDQVDGRKLSWKPVKEMRAFGILLLGGVMIVFQFTAEKQKQKEQRKKEIRQMQFDYPQLINKFSLYIGAGMTVRRAWIQIVKEYDKEKHYLGERTVYAQAFCATYILGKRYGVDVSGFDLEKVAGIQEHGQKDPQELRLFLNDVRTAAYGIRGHIERNLREPEQQFVTEDTFTVGESEKKSPDKGKKSKNEPER